ncbi:hypothetical protein [Amycolatopsis saalfeldensis]|uniref:DUF4386 family protein n=1 Tax=Amycolatopsis saalfeldensis TaxID=394193 RepID=A0A1H8VJ06_9PSEU|nr:hypothetical protein [Amycolatopsis saalfeldensis]SEP15280.1 hypothetical protein SAMN04489732_10486 [Amycolatopsis saalfeldensis]
MTAQSRTGIRRINAGVIASVSGVLLPVASNLLVPIWQMPSTSASGPEVARFVVDQQAALRATLALDTAGVTLWLIFGGAAWLRLRRVSASDTLATSLFGVAFSGMVLLLLAGFTSSFVLAYRTPAPATAQLLYDLTFALLAMSGMPAAVALGAYATVVFTTKRLPRPTGDLAILTAAAHILLLVSLVTPRGILSLEGPLITVVPALLFAWILTTAPTLRRGLSNERCGSG